MLRSTAILNTLSTGWLLLRNRWVVFAYDLLWIPLAVLAAYWVRFNLATIPPIFLYHAALVIIVALPINALTFWLFGCYRGIWRFASVPDLVRLIKAVVMGALATALIVFLVERLQHVPRSVLVIYPVFLLFALSGSRLLYRAIRDLWVDWVNNDSPRALVVGAGEAGETLIRSLKRNRMFTPVALLDDDPAKLGHEIHGVRVRGSTAELGRLIQAFGATIVLVAMPNAPREVLERVVQCCNEAKVKCRTLPSVAEIAGGQVEVSRLRPFTVEDLLRRDPIVLDTQAVSSFLRGKRVLVTGGGGSIGSELCRRISLHEPGLLAILDNCEYNLYGIDQELSGKYPKLIFSSLLGDVCNERTVSRVFEQIKPQAVFHAAAYKHVPMLEDNAIEGIRNNVFGTCMVADAAKRCGVETFVLISTDKTVNPTNVMGTTKRVAELYCQSLNEASGTHFITTRFGNVLASTGSVIPLFEHQIATGGPVTVTHPEITRYFMTIPEAATLILQASAAGKGGEIFVLDMGEPVRIAELAEKMIQLSGLQVGRDIEITYIGLRPGEKLHEELFYAQEALRQTVHPKLLLADNHVTTPGEVHAGLKQLTEAVTAGDELQALHCLKALVPEFQPSVSPEERLQKHARPYLQIVK